MPARNRIALDANDVGTRGGEIAGTPGEYDGAAVAVTLGVGEHASIAVTKRDPYNRAVSPAPPNTSPPTALLEEDSHEGS
jgi:hypothetical protein